MLFPVTYILCERTCLLVVECKTMFKLCCDSYFLGNLVGEKQKNFLKSMEGDAAETSGKNPKGEVVCILVDSFTPAFRDLSFSVILVCWQSFCRIVFRQHCITVQRCILDLFVGLYRSVGGTLVHMQVNCDFNLYNKVLFFS